MIGIEVIRVHELVLLNIPLSVPVPEQMPLSHSLCSELLSGHLEIALGLIRKWSTGTMPHNFVNKCKLVLDLRR